MCLAQEPQRSDAGEARTIRQIMLLEVLTMSKQMIHYVSLKRLS